MSASALLNAHINRVMDDGATSPVTIDSAAWLIVVDAWLTSNDLWKYLLHWVNPAFGVAKSGSNISKIYCLGTTRLPRGGDYTPFDPTKTTYSATGMNGTVPGWTNASAGYGYFGGGRFNQIRRKLEITVVAAYKKPDSTKKTFLATDEFGGFSFCHDSDGSAKFNLHDDVTSDTASKSVSSHTTANIIAGTFNSSTTDLTTYVEGAPGVAKTATLHSNLGLTLRTTLWGRITPTFPQPFLCSGSTNSKYDSGIYQFSDNEAAFSASDLIVFEKDIGSTLIADLTTLLRTRIGA